MKTVKLSVQSQQTVAQTKKKLDALNERVEIINKRQEALEEEYEILQDQAEELTQSQWDKLHAELGITAETHVCTINEAGDEVEILPRELKITLVEKGLVELIKESETVINQFQENAEEFKKEYNEKETARRLAVHNKSVVEAKIKQCFDSRDEVKKEIWDSVRAVHPELDEYKHLALDPKTLEVTAVFCDHEDEFDGMSLPGGMSLPEVMAQAEKEIKNHMDKSFKNN